jgi:hypothetical protein
MPVSLAQLTGRSNRAKVLIDFVRFANVAVESGLPLEPHY